MRRSDLQHAANGSLQDWCDRNQVRGDRNLQFRGLQLCADKRRVRREQVVRGGWRVLRVQGGFELRRGLREMRRRDAEVQGLGNHFAVRWVPLGFGLRRCHAKLQRGNECLRTAAFVRRLGGDLRSERGR